jgi:hypothetical protein
MISPLVAVASRAALYPIQSIIIIALFVSGAYFHLLDIARNSPESSLTNDGLYAMSSSAFAPMESTIWAQNLKGEWKWTVNPVVIENDVRLFLMCFNKLQSHHIHLAWGQIGVSETSGQDQSTSSLSISEQIIQSFQSKSSSPCFPIRERENASHCLFTASTVSTSNLLSVEIGVLLSESLSNFESWQNFLKQMHIPGAQLLEFESGDNTRSDGGSAAGNLVWLVQSLYHTYSRTAELVKVFPFYSRIMAKYP